MRLNSPSRLLRTALLFALCSIALTGCFRVELAIKVNEDGSGVISTLLAIEDQFVDALSDLGGLSGDSADIENSLGTLFEDAPPNAVVEEYSEDGFTGQRMTIEVPDIVQGLQNPQIFGEAAESTEGGEFNLEREGDGWRFTATLPPTDLGDAGEDSLLGIDPSALLESASYTIRLALPGEVTDHNADRVEDDELVWDIDLTATEPQTFSALSQPPSGLTNWAILAIGIAGAAALILAVGFLVTRSRRST